MISAKDRFTEKIINRINSVVKNQPDLSRYRLSQLVCDWLDWKGHDGRRKDVSCRVAMLKLHKQGIIDLPPVKSDRLTIFGKAQQVEAENYSWPKIHCNLSELGQLELVTIERGNKSLSKIWNAMMDKYHYLGSGPLCGAQIRYLIKSEAGWLGGLSFSAAAWKVKPRDQWISWSDLERKKNLDKVVNNSRFLILPQVEIKNLASHILAKVTKRLPNDWQKRYGYAPVLLETFVEKSFSGTCYRSANWQRVGETQGRGRQDFNHEAKKTVKDIYLYPLTRNFRKELCAKLENVYTPTSPVTSLAMPPEDWAEEEFGQVDLVDDRLNKRLLTLGRDFYARPQANIPQACGTRSKTKAAYRFFENERTDMEKILKSHYESTIKRIATHSVVLAVQDSSGLSYSSHPSTTGLGPLSTEKCEQGLWLHDTMTYNLEGTPLGLINVQVWARDIKDFGKKKKAYKTPIEEKESYKWLESYLAAVEVQKQCPQTILVSVGDREADIYELFTEAKKYPNGPKLLVRAKNNRKLKEEQEHLWEYMKLQPVSGIQEVQVPRKGNRAARVARMEIRFAKIQLEPPEYKNKLEPVTLWAVLALETNVPENVKPLQWMLLTTVEVTNFKEACEKLAWYALRWGIEVYHRTLKSGCKIKTRQLGNANRLKTCLAIDMVIAWRIYHLAKLGRETPNVPCTVYFQEEEWKALLAFINKNPIPPEEPPKLREAVRMVASLGGFLGRKSDGEPGTKTMWLGLQRLDDITVTRRIFTENVVPNLQEQTVSSKLDYG